MVTHLSFVGEYLLTASCIVVPISISAVLACLITSLTIVDIAKPRLLRPKQVQLIVASLSFTADGRLLIQEDGSIPHERVEIDGIYDVSRVSCYALLGP